MITMTAKEKMVKARTGLILDNPFFGSLSLNLRFVENPNCFPPTLYTDGSIIGYHPEFVDKLSLEQCKTAIAHEVMHCAMAHMVRRGDRHPGGFNIACDYVVNSLLDKAGFAHIVDKDAGIEWLMDSKYSGKYAEEVYDMLPKEQKTSIQIQFSIDGSGNEKGQGKDKGQGKGQTRGFDYIIDAKSPSGNRELSESERHSIEQDWKIKVGQAAQQAKQMGNLPAGFERFIGDILDPKVHWRDVLREFVNEVSRNDYSWQLPNRRYMHQGFYLPGMQSQEVGTACIIIDTSGSIGNKELAQFAGEISQILEDFPGIKIRVIYVDTKAYDGETFEHEDLPITLDAKGGGGTDFAPGFDLLEKEGADLKFLLYFTDMWCNSYPDFTPQYPVLWINTSNGESHYGDPPFGEVLSITLE